MINGIKKWISERSRNISSVLEIADLDGEFDEALATIIHECLQDIGPKWISVEDGGFEDYAEVLCLSSSGDQLIGTLYDGVCESDYQMLAYVTYWMPLIEPPNEN